MTPEKILIIQLRRVGDVIFTLPVIGALKNKFPGARIDFLVEPPSDQLVRRHPGLNETLVYEKDRSMSWISAVRKRRYDWILDFHSNGRTLILTLFSGASLKAGFDGPLSRRLIYNRRARSTDRKYIVEQKLELLKELGVESDHWDWGISVPAAESDRAEKLLRDSGWRPEKGNLIGIAPATRRATRSWIPERFREAARVFYEKGFQVLLLWGPGEEEWIKTMSGGVPVIVPPDTTLLELSALIQKCSLVLAVDNGPKNIAVALNVPTITILGPTNPLSFNPHHDPRHRVIRDEDLFCISCGLNTCPYGHECMQNVTVPAVISEVEALLENRPPALSLSAGGN